jgi:uncharacterized membrane protein
MKRWIVRIVMVLVLAAGFHLATIMLYPYGIMLALSKKNAKAGREFNRFYHAPRVTSASRTVVRPSPDLLYSAAAFDISKGPLKISALVPDTYWSLSFYATNTDNFFVVNDRELDSEKAEFLLVGPDTPVPESGNAKVVVAPTERGAVLIRMLITDETRVEELVRLQRSAVCEPVL